jgi:hypothetical protein
MKLRACTGILAGTGLILAAPLAGAQTEPTTDPATGAETEVEGDQQGPDVDMERRPEPAPPPVVGQEPPAEYVPMPQERAYVYEEPEAPLVLPRRGRKLDLAVMLGGGVQGFIEDEARQFSDTGGAWGVRVAVGNESILAAEVGYLGAAQNITALGLDQSAFLLTNGAEAVARFNFLTGAIQPYILGGAGWTNFRVTGDDFNNSSVADSENVLHLPIGAGIGARFEDVRIDARGTVRAVPEGSLFTGEEGDMHTWNANLTAGWEF